uniref:NADH-ubiquinone oxidoreductase chain 2 n=1 Tax=Nephus oblongosignatus TaxID=2772058 RepID=A0A7H1DNM9_9CUCU|nr:NADH dehydrogenase subunit 2 [Nephus oblongosignatus]QNS38574.1 NADH dehydrogenase subunit 2 [Nephus oblongosignatus]
MKWNKILFILMLISGTFISISSFSWFSMWMGLELNLLSFIPLMNESTSKSSEASLKYFIIQALSSMFVLYSILMTSMINENLSILETPLTLILNSALLTKLGAAPFHFWFPEIIEGLNWMNSLILLTWQKIAPFTLLTYNFYNINFFSMIIFMSMLISGIMIWNQTSLKKIMVYSSINHIGWMLSILLFSPMIWMNYFLIYSFMSLILISMFKKFEIYSIQDIFNFTNLSKFSKLFFFLNFLSLGGLPPFLGFFPKWMTLKILMSNNLIFLPLVMIFFTLLTLYVYLQICIQSLILKFEEKKNFFPFSKSFTIPSLTFINVFGLISFTLILNFA